MIGGERSPVSIPHLGFGAALTVVLRMELSSEIQKAFREFEKV